MWSPRGLHRALSGAAILATTLIAASPQATADTVFFAPGAAQAGANANFLAGSCAVLGCTAANLDAPQEVTQWQWAAVNNRVSSPSTGDTQTWRIVVDTAVANKITVGDTFTESFSFHLVTVQNEDSSSAEYGFGGGLFRSHVVMKANLSGHIAAVGAQPAAGVAKGPIVSGDLPMQNGLQLVYDTVSFDWFFNPDAKDDDTPGNPKDEILIARLGLTDWSGQGSAAGLDFNLVWNTSFDEVLPGVFFNEDGIDLASDQDADSALGAAGGLKKLRLDAKNDPLGFMTTEQNVKLRRERSTDLNLFATSSGPATGTSVMTIGQSPEPATLALLGAGLLGLGALGRRRRA